MRKIIYYLLFLPFLSSCKKQEIPSSTETRTNITVLGKKLENPYSVENMRRAYNNLKSDKVSHHVSTEGIEIKATHYYIKFKPRNQSELDTLKNDSTLVFYNYPLDYEIHEGNTYYHDPSLPDSIPTFQYCSVPVGKTLPDVVEYEVLSDLFIPDERSSESTTSSVGGASGQFVEALVDEALRITGNLPAKGNKGAKTLGGSWRPAGTIRIWDNTTNSWRGVEGVEVKARRWFTTHDGITNADGYYSCNGTFRHDANYSLDWERYNFALREGWLDGANINGPKIGGNWDLDFTNGKSMFHAEVFMAAFHYYYKDIRGLRRPPENGFFKTQLRIRCYDEENGEANGNHAPYRRFLGLGSAIKIYNPQNGIQAVYGTTIHELAHASHWNMDSKGYNNCEDIVAESWARGVQWELTRMIWPAYVAPYGRRKVGNSPNKPSWYNYTGVVEDMIDPRQGYDQVEGYTIRQVEDALKDQESWNGWRNNILNNYNNETENNLGSLFDYWN